MGDVPRKAMSGASFDKVGEVPKLWRLTPCTKHADYVADCPQCQEEVLTCKTERAYAAGWRAALASQTHTPPAVTDARSGEFVSSVMDSAKAPTIADRVDAAQKSASIVSIPESGPTSETGSIPAGAAGGRDVAERRIGADARAYAHKCIERVEEMRKLDLARAKEQPEQVEYYLGRAHRCDDILFWLGEYESHIEAGLSEETNWWHKRWHQDTGIPCDGTSEYCPLIARRKPDEALAKNVSTPTVCPAGQVVEGEHDL
jgi:hypothetical protein